MFNNLDSIKNTNFIFISIQKMIRNLERCLARVNEHLYKNKILVAVEDKGKLSCHKINLIFMYFDGTECIVSL